MSINWYPGHMKKTKDLIRDNIKLVDVVIELLDSRIPESSRNPQFDELLKDKKRIVALNKSDLSDASILKEWVQAYGDKGIKAIPINALNGAGTKELIREVNKSCEEMIARMVARGRIARPIRIMIVGIPNVGKSSLINNLAGKKATQTGNRPGVTKGKQWIRLNKALELFDTPGILWPKIDDDFIGYKLAFSGAIKDDVLNIEDIGYEFIKYMMKIKPDLMKQRYEVEFDEETDPLMVMDDIARRRGCIMRGQELDYEKVSRLIIDEFRKGVIGKITLERPKQNV